LVQKFRRLAGSDRLGRLGIDKRKGDFIHGMTGL
jgi:hypothetical protein